LRSEECRLPKSTIVSKNHNEKNVSVTKFQNFVVSKNHNEKNVSVSKFQIFVVSKFCSFEKQTIRGIHKKRKENYKSR